MSFEKWTKKHLDGNSDWPCGDGMFGPDVADHIRACYAEIDRSTALLRECVEALDKSFWQIDIDGEDAPPSENYKATSALLTRARAFLEGK